MNPTGIAIFAERLNALGEVYDKKPITKGALQVWVDTLREFPTERVLDVLNSWPRKRNKFPTPSEVWTMANEASIEEREKTAAHHRVQNRSEDLPAARSENARQYIERMRKLVANPKPLTRVRFVQHWREMLESEHSTHLQKMFAKEALQELRGVEIANRILDQQREGIEQGAEVVESALIVTGDGPAPRVPGEDDEPVDEFTLLQAELERRANA